MTAHETKRRLTLVRHAKSSWDEAGLADHERPLNVRGTRDCKRMGIWCSEHLPEPDLWLVSSAHRTQETARALADAYDLAPQVLTTEGRLYGADSREYASLLQGCDAQFRHVLVVGHNPGISEYASYLAADIKLMLPTLGLVDFLLDMDTWQELQPTRAELVFYVTPKSLT